MNTSRSNQRASGTQVVDRIVALLRELSTAMPDGRGTSGIARATGIVRPTAHRLLTSLADHGFVDRDHRTGRWFLGPELYMMGSVSAERFDITELAQPHVSALADATGESAFLSARRGGETICLLRQDGSFPIRSFVLFEGKRFPLGVASAGLAILSFLPDDVIEQIIVARDFEAAYGDQYTELGLRESVAQTRRTGYSVNPGLIVEGSWGMGAAVFDPHGEPAWALSLTGIESRFSAERHPELGRLLLDQAHRLTQRLAQR